MMQVCACMVLEDLGQEDVEVVQSQKTISTDHHFDKLQNARWPELPASEEMY